MFSYRRFVKHIHEKYDASFLEYAAKKDAKKLAELLYIDTAEFFSFGFGALFESNYFRKYFIREIERVATADDAARKVISRAFNSVRDVYSQKKAMLMNRSRSANLDLVLSAIDISTDAEISQMHVTISVLKNILDLKTYKELRKYVRKKFGSCRASAQYFLYVLSQIEKFEENIENRKEIEEEQNVKEQKNEKKIDKSIEIHTSESDYKKYKKGEKLDDETKLKLYIYRRKYQEELSSLRLSRLTKDDALFFIINAERFVENNTLSLNNVLKIIRYADSNIEIKNPIGWLISRFSISRGRFYFLLRKSNPKSSEDEKQQEKHHRKQKQEKSYTTKRYDTYIREDLAYFIRKYSVPIRSITDYVRKMNLHHGDMSIAVEQYLISYIWKNRITADEKAKLIDYAKKELKKFVTPPPQNEAVNYIKSIIRNIIREEYLTLSTEDKIHLFSRKQHHNLHHQYCDTS